MENANYEILEFMQEICDFDSIQSLEELLNNPTAFNGGRAQSLVSDDKVQEMFDLFSCVADSTTEQ